MADLELRQIVKRFGEVTVVQRLDLLVTAGEFVVLLGESGCGKSTTLRMVAGLEEVTEGQVLIGGKDVTHAHHCRARCDLSAFVSAQFVDGVPVLCPVPSLDCCRKHRFLPVGARYTKGGSTTAAH
jgi:ABC-type transporter Mla maintaining outer membrane lipid asymmetry ATPase subunit MlaF